MRIDQARKYLAIYRALLELHHIACEGASLVGEYELDLAHLFDEVRVAAQRETCLGVIYVHIFSNQVRLSELDHL